MATSFKEFVLTATTTTKGPTKLQQTYRQPGILLFKYIFKIMKENESWLHELPCDHAALKSVCSFSRTLAWSGKALDDYQYVQEQSPDRQHSCDVEKVLVSDALEEGLDVSRAPVTHKWSWNSTQKLPFAKNRYHRWANPQPGPFRSIT